MFMTTMRNNVEVGVVCLQDIQHVMLRVVDVVVSGEQIVQLCGIIGDKFIV